MDRCIWLSESLKERNKAANYGGGRHSEKEAWIWMMYIITPLCGLNVTSGPGVCAHVGGSRNVHDKQMCDCVRTRMYDEATNLRDRVCFQGAIAIPVLLGGMFGVT